jgi:hypothetical protein
MQCDTLLLTLHPLATAALVLAAVRCGAPRVLPVELTVRYRSDASVNLDVGLKEVEENDHAADVKKDSECDAGEKSPHGFWGRGWTDAACE